MTSKTCSKCTPGSAFLRVLSTAALAAVLAPLSARAGEPAAGSAAASGFVYVDRDGRAHVISVSPGAPAEAEPERGPWVLPAAPPAVLAATPALGGGAPWISAQPPLDPADIIGPPDPARSEAVSRALHSDVDAVVPYLALAREAAGHYSLPPELVLAVMRVESAFDARAVSRAGALGLMQLMPGTAADMLVDDPLDPRQNVFGGARFLRILVNRFGGDVPLAVAAYNAGPGAVERWRGIPPYPETAEYVMSVLAYYHRLLPARPSEGPPPGL
jgi:soluble lytic murein transglycosylase-like protein